MEQKTSPQMIPNEFGKALRELALAHAPKPVAKCGDIVTVKGSWLKPHRVKIIQVGVEIVDQNGPTVKLLEWGVTGWVGVQSYYFGYRVNAEGKREGGTYALYLNDLTTDDGQHWERRFNGYNHVGLMFEYQEEGKHD